MKRVCFAIVCAIACSLTSVASAAQISGEYIEARTCDVYTGPCFANGDLGLTGREAVMAWKVDKGTWAGQDLQNLGVAVVIRATDTLGIGGSFYVNPEPIQAVILIDEKANKEQRDALVAFVKESAPHLTKHIVKIESAPITLTNDHLSGKGVFSAGKFAKIETRKLQGGDCVCTNEVIFYPPLTKVENSHPAYTLSMSFDGEGLNSTWTTVNRRSAFLATFSK